MKRVNVDFERSKKEFWAFVGRNTKGMKWNIASLRNGVGVSVTSTKGEFLLCTCKSTLEYMHQSFHWNGST